MHGHRQGRERARNLEIAHEAQHPLPRSVRRDRPVSRLLWQLQTFALVRERRGRGKQPRGALPKNVHRHTRTLHGQGDTHVVHREVKELELHTTRRKKET